MLAVPFIKNGRINYGRYLTKRICRIWLPFAAAILLSAFLSYLLRADGPPNYWTYETWTDPVDIRVLLSHFLLIGGSRDMSLDIVMWSLVHEMRISIIYPLIILMVLWRPGVAIGTAIVLQIVSACFRAQETTFVSVTIAGSGFYVLFFVLGAAIAANVDFVRGLLNRQRPGTRITLLAAAALLLMIPPGGMIREEAWLVGAILILATLLADCRMQTSLEAPIPKWLGRVSYSLYLVHIPVLTAMVFAFSPFVPQWVIMSAGLVLCLIAAELFHRFVEAPSIEFGRFLTSLGRASVAVLPD